MASLHTIPFFLTHFTSTIPLSIPTYCLLKLSLSAMCTSYLYVIALQFDFTLRMTILELFSDDRHAIAFPGLRLFSVNGVGGYHIRVLHFLNAPLTRARSGSLGALHAV